MRKRETVYVSCALTGMSADYVGKIKGVIATIQSRGHGMLHWQLVQPSWTPAQLYRHDKRCAKECTVMLVICDERSTGMGMEAAFGIDCVGKPVLFVAHRDSVVTPMVLGAAEVEPNSQLVRYNSLAEVPDLFDAFLAEVREIDMPLFAETIAA